MGLDGDKYGEVRSNLLNMDPLPSLNKAYQCVAQEEHLRGMPTPTARLEVETVTTFKVQSETRGRGKSTETSDLFCNHCNREGHDESTCFQIHGFPEWWGDRPRGGRGGSNSRRRGGRSRRSGRGARANNVVVNHSSGSGTIGTRPWSTAEATRLSGFTT